MNYRDTLMWKELNEYGAVFQNAEKNGAQWSEVAAEMKRRGISHLIGAARGTSDHALVFLKYLTEIFTPYTVGFAACSTLTKYGGAADYGKALVIGGSQSGKAADVLAVIKKAKEDGALTVTLTNDAESPLAKAADYHFCLHAGEEKSVAATKTFTAQCYLLLQFVAALSDSPVPAQALAAIPAVIENNRAEIESASDRLSDALKDVREGILLARGISYALALEGTLKLQETSYVRMKGYADSDFLHGPMAMVEPGLKVIALAPAIGFVDADRENERREELADLFSRLKNQGASLDIISTSKEFLPFGNVCALEGGANEVETYFVLALLIQMTACKTSCKKGGNPDAPRALRKVTVTK